MAKQWLSSVFQVGALLFSAPTITFDVLGPPFIKLVERFNGMTVAVQPSMKSLTKFLSTPRLSC